MFQIDVDVAGWYQAWECYADGCPGSARLTVMPVVVGCDSIPGLTVEFAQMSHAIEPDCSPRMQPLPARRTTWGRVKTLHR